MNNAAAVSGMFGGNAKIITPKLKTTNMTVVGSKEAPIAEAKIKAVVACLKEVQKLIIANNYKTTEFQHIEKRHGAPLTSIYTAIRLGVFKKLDRGRFAVNIKEIDPIHAREVILEIKNRERARLKQRREDARAGNPPPEAASKKPYAEIIHSSKKGDRRVHSVEFKRMVVQESKTTSTAAVCEKYNLSSSLIWLWANNPLFNSAGSKEIKQPDKKTEQSPVKTKPETEEEKSFKALFIDSMVERFRRSLESQDAKALSDINKAMMEKGII